MSLLRVFLALALVAAVCAAPAHQTAGRSHHEEEAGAELSPGGTPVVGESTAASEGAAESRPDVQTSVSTSTSVEITSVTSSVTSEMSPMPETTEEEEESSEEESGSGEAEEAEEASVAAEEGEVSAMLVTPVDPESEEAAIVAQVEAIGAQLLSAALEAETAQAQIEKAAELEKAGEEEEDVTSNEIDDGVSTASPGAEVVKQAAEEETTSRPPTVDVTTSTSVAMTEMTMSVSAVMTPHEEVGGVVSDATEAVLPQQVHADDAQTSVLAIDFEGSGIEADFEGSGIEADFDGSVDAQAFELDESSGEPEPKEEDNTTKGTLIFDLGANTTPELHDLVQQTVLEALMDEGLLASTEVNPGVAPSIEVEGSGVVFLDEAEGSGDVSADGSGDGITSLPFVSIHF